MTCELKGVSLVEGQNFQLSGWWWLVVVGDGWWRLVVVGGGASALSFLSEWCERFHTLSTKWGTSGS